MKSTTNPKETTMLGRPYPDTRSTSRRRTWIVTERRGDFIEHHRFDSEDEAQAFIESRQS